MILKYYLSTIKHKIMNFMDIHFNKKSVVVKEPNETVFVMLAADYNNLGDVAITYAQSKFLKNVYKNKEIIEVSVEDTCKVYKSMKKKINKNTIITIIGGGNTGEKYELIEQYRRFIIRKFKKNIVIGFPQTIDFTKSCQGKISLNKSIRSYSKNKNLIVLARETKSYETFKSLFTNCNVYLIPDIVLSLKLEMDFNNRSGILFLLRNDTEKSLSKNFENNMKNEIKNMFKKCEESDTCIIDFDNTKKYDQLKMMLGKVASHEIVITDRLHGMIMAYITKTPCIVFKNNNHKIEMTYNNWLKDSNYITLYSGEDIESIKEKVRNLINLNSKQPSKTVEIKFEELKSILTKYK